MSVNTTKKNVEFNEEFLKKGVRAHISCYIDTPCEIGTNSCIWHFTHIMENCHIGERCNIGQNVVISPNVLLGNNVKIQNNVSVYTGVICEDDVFLGPSMVFTNVINPRSHVIRRDEYKTTRVKKGASIGANATIVCGITLGEYCFVGAGSVVTKDVPAYALVYGNPARIRGWICVCGVKLTLGKSHAFCSVCKSKFQLVEKDFTDEIYLCAEASE
ncbi:MAG: N-acetyltransferase [Oligoflexia bacterium]|nr:N-acetyltransferase [Oligoflexia bacterium]